MMDGRVKTLHPPSTAASSPGVTADDLAAHRRARASRRSTSSSSTSIRSRGGRPPETPFDALVEEIDIGGPSLVRAAAKNFRDVLVVVDPADYLAVLEQLRARRSVARVPVRADAQGVRAHRRRTTRRSPTLNVVTWMAATMTRGCRERRTASPDRCATERIRISRQAGISRPTRPIRTVARASGQGAVVHEPARPRCGARIALEFDEPAASSSSTRIRAASRPARRRGGLRPRARRRSAVRVRRHRRPQPPIDAETARALTSTFIEAVIAPPRSRRRAGPRDQAEPARGHRDFRARWASLGSMRRCGRSSAACWCRSAIAWSRRAIAMAARGLSEGRDASGAPTRGGMDGAALRVARVRAREVEHRHLHRRRSDARGRRRPDEPRRCREGGGHEGGGGALLGSVAASDAFFPFRDGLDARRRRRRDRGRAARRIGARRRGHRRRRRARPRDGVHGTAALQALMHDALDDPASVCRCCSSRLSVFHRPRRLVDLGRQRGVLRRDAARDDGARRLRQSRRSTTSRGSTSRSSATGSSPASITSSASPRRPADSDRHRRHRAHRRRRSSSGARRVTAGAGAAAAAPVGGARLRRSRRGC